MPLKIFLNKRPPNSASYNVITDKSTCRPVEEMGWWTENHEVVKEKTFLLEIEVPTQRIEKNLEKCEEKDNMCVCDVKCKKPFVSKALV